MKRSLSKRIVLLAVCVSLIDTPARAIFPVNFFRPWDINLRPWPRDEARFHVAGYDEVGLKVYSYADDYTAHSPLQIWTETQDAIAMLKGFPQDSAYTQYLQNVLLMPTDNGVRGHLVPKGKLYLNASAGLSGYYNAPHGVQLSVHLPVYSMVLKDVIFDDLTRDVTAQDIRVKQDLTNNFVERMKLFDPTLNLEGWNKTGVGDLALMGEWRGFFRQNKPWLKDVKALLRAAITFPTATSRNENDIFSIPFGYEGFGTFFGGGLTLTWWDRIRGGVDFEFLNIFGNSKLRRVKVNEDQTDFLLLAQAQTYKEFGFTQRYQLFFETCTLWGGLSFGVAYQYWKHGKDKLNILSPTYGNPAVTDTLLTPDYSNRIANSAVSLQEWTMHQLIFKIWYNYERCTPSKIEPQILLFYKLPINGHRSVMFETIGALFIWSF